MAPKTLQEEGRKKLIKFISEDTDSFFSENKNNLKHNIHMEKYLTNSI